MLHTENNENTVQNINSWQSSIIRLFHSGRLVTPTITTNASPHATSIQYVSICTAPSNAFTHAVLLPLLCSFVGASLSISPTSSSVPTFTATIPVNISQSDLLKSGLPQLSQNSRVK